jgi:hypothetical protein
VDAGRLAAPAVVTLTVWGVTPRRVPAAIVRMGLDRWLLRGTPGLRFARLLGTGDGRTFTLRDADPLHWALLAVWDGVPDADQFAVGRTHRRWDRLCDERLDVVMTPLASRGLWAGKEPFGSMPAPGATATASPGGLYPEPSSGLSSGRFLGDDDALVASITRARLRPSRAVSFWRAVPPVSADLAAVEGLLFAIGIGEAPIGLQGTFSLWRSAAALNEFAFRRAAHADVVRRTGRERWYTEELFARFAVRAVSGTFAGRHLLTG